MMVVMVMMMMMVMVMVMMMLMLLLLLSPWFSPKHVGLGACLQTSTPRVPWWRVSSTATSITSESLGAGETLAETILTDLMMRSKEYHLEMHLVLSWWSIAILKLDQLHGCAIGVCGMNYPERCPQAVHPLAQHTWPWIHLPRIREQSCSEVQVFFVPSAVFIPLYNIWLWNSGWVSHPQTVHGCLIYNSYII